MRRHLVAQALSVCLIFAPAVAKAGPDEDLRDAARAEAAKLREQGWPKERCFAGISFFNNTVVEGNGKLLAGDRLLYVNATSVESANTETIIEALGAVPPNSTLTVQVRRAGEVINVEQLCGNLADYQRPYLQALAYAGEKKWYDCVDALAGREDALYLALRARCAGVSRRADEYPIQEWMDTAAKRTIAMGAYAPDNRTNIASSLLRSRMDLSADVFRSLVQEVRSWDAGATWESVQPDLAILRQAAERGVRGRLIDPQSAIIEMPYDFIYGTWTPAFSGVRVEGFMTCGTVNAKNRMGGYTGTTSFISVVDEAGLEKYTDMDSATSDYIRPVDAACAQLTKRLTFIGNAGDGQAGKAATPPALSVSQELEKLAELHASGTLTEEEYAAAKARVISGN